MTDAVNAGETELTLMISTPGGMINAGMTAHNLLNTLPLQKIECWNVGNIDSIGVMLFLVGTERYAVPNSRFLFHDVFYNIPAGQQVPEITLRLYADELKNNRDAMAQLSSSVTGQPANVIADMMANGRILSPSEAKELNFIADERTLTLPQGVQIDQITD